jgi:hypothetical protein
MAWWLWITGKFMEGIAAASIAVFIKKMGVRSKPKPILGHLAKFNLNLDGDVSPGAFTVSGHVVGQSHLLISIEGQKQADVVLYSPRGIWGNRFNP